MPKETVTRVIDFSLDEVRLLIAEKMNINLRYQNINVDYIEGKSSYDGPGFSRGPFAGLRVTVTDKENAN